MAISPTVIHNLQNSYRGQITHTGCFLWSSTEYVYFCRDEIIPVCYCLRVNWRLYHFGTRTKPLFEGAAFLLRNKTNSTKFVPGHLDIASFSRSQFLVWQDLLRYQVLPYKYPDSLFYQPTVHRSGWDFRNLGSADNNSGHKLILRATHFESFFLTIVFQSINHTGSHLVLGD